MVARSGGSKLSYVSINILITSTIREISSTPVTHVKYRVKGRERERVLKVEHKMIYKP